MSNLQCLKLVTGEEIIGDVSKLSDGSIKVKNAAAIVMMPGASNKVNLGLVPFLPYAEDDTFTFDHVHIILLYKPATDLINNYNRIFGSGIQIASAL